MENVKVMKVRALEVLKKNREEHKKIFLEAVAGYKKQALAILNQHIKNITDGKMNRVSVSLPTPEEHTKDYDRAIKMLEMSVDDTIIMDESSFQCYIMDDWTWKRQFLTSNATYSGTAAAAISEAGLEEAGLEEAGLEEAGLEEAGLEEAGLEF